MRESTKGILLGILGTLVLGASIGTAWMVGAGRGLVFTDGGRIRVPASAAPVREVLWEPADLLPDWINQDDENYEPRMSADGRTLLFVRGKAGGGADLFGVERTRDGWGEAFPLAGVNTPMADELGPSLSADGGTLYFYSDREGGQGGYDLWCVRRVDAPDPNGGLGAERQPSPGTQRDADRQAGREAGPSGARGPRLDAEHGPSDTRSGEFPSGTSPAATGPMGASLRDATWGTPQNLGPGVNSAYNDYGPAPSPDGATMYFASNRPKAGDPAEDASRAWPATVREDLERRDYDLYSAPITDRGMGQASRLGTLTTPSNEGTPAVSPAGDFLYFASDRAGGAGGLDLYRARIRDDAPLVAENLGWPINTPANELDPALSMNGFALHFSSNRGEGLPEAADSRGEDGSASPLGASPTAERAPGTAPTLAARYAIYSTLSREVFRERQPVLAGFGWSAAWGAVWPWILLLGLTALLAYLIRRYLRDVDLKKRWRRLSLIAKCLVLSLVMHGLLAMLFTVWYVSGEVGELIRGQGGGTRVSLVSRAVGSDLASQIRGGLTDLTVAGESPSAIRATPAIESEARFLEATFSAERLETSDSRLELEPDQSAADSRPQIDAPRPNQPALDPLASAAPSIATPEAAAGQAAAEARASLSTQETTEPTPTASLPTGSGAASARLDVSRVRTGETELPSSQSRSAAAEAAPSGSRVEPAGAAVVIERASGTTGPLVTPQSTAAPIREESTVTMSPTQEMGEPQSPTLPAEAMSSGGGSAPARLEVSRVRATDANLSDSQAARSRVEAAPSGSRVAPVGASVMIAPTTGPSGAVATPASATGESREESRVGVTPVEAGQPAGSPALPVASMSTDGGGPTLAPERTSGGPDVSLNATGNASATDSAARVAAGSQRSTRPVDASAIPATAGSVFTALPRPASVPGPTDRSAGAERTLEIGTPDTTGRTQPRGSFEAPALAQTGPASLAPEASRNRPTEGSLASDNARATEAARSPSTNPGSSSAPSIQVEPSAQGLWLALPGAPNAHAPIDEQGDQPGWNLSDALASPTALRPDLLPGASTGDITGTSLDPARTSTFDADRSLARSGESHADDRAASSSPDAVAIPTTSSSIPMDLSSRPVPTLALPVATQEPPAGAAVEPIGTLAGVIRDSQTGEPISSARIRLDLPDTAPIVARSNARGQYRLRVPPGIPDNVAISAVAPGYTPASINVSVEEIERAESRGGALTRDFDLTPLAWDVVPIEGDPQVHHLGNDEFEGAINSQFQRGSEGLVYEATFTLDASQVGAAIRSAELLILAKGAQARNPIRINGRDLEGFIVETPRDGSFGELVFRVPPRWLRAGANTIEIESVRGSNDLDDFEFVNPRIRLRPSAVR